MKTKPIPAEGVAGGYVVTSVFNLIGDINQFRQMLVDDRKPMTMSAVATDDDWEIITDAIFQYVYFSPSDAIELASRDVLNDRQFRALADRASHLPLRLAEAARSIAAGHGIHGNALPLHRIAAAAPLSVAHRLSQLIVLQKASLFLPHETDLSG